MPVTEEVYVKFMLDPSMATRYIDKVREFESSGAVQVASEEQPPAEVKPFAPVSEVIHHTEYIKPLNFQLQEVSSDSDVHVLFVVDGDKISRVDQDQSRVAPPSTIYGVSRKYALDALFYTTLTKKNPTQTIGRDTINMSQLWINNPTPGFSYGIKVTS